MKRPLPLLVKHFCCNFPLFIDVSLCNEFVFFPAFGNCFVKSAHALTFAAASLAFVSGFCAHFVKASIMNTVIFVQYKMVVLKIVTQIMERLSSLMSLSQKYIS